MKTALIDIADTQVQVLYIRDAKTLTVLSITTLCGRPIARIGMDQEWFHAQLQEVLP